MDYDTFKRAAIRDQDTIEQCPYNPSHQIVKSKMQYHLVRCAKQYPTVDIVTCPFNATHRVQKPELSYHAEICPDRRIMDSEKYQIQSEGPKRVVNSQSFAAPPVPPSEENWDEDDMQSTYEPEKHVKNKMVFRNLPGGTKSQRKQFCLEERRRFNQLSVEGSEPPPVPLEEADRPLRPPKTLPKGLAPLESNARLGMGRGSPSCSSIEVTDSAKIAGRARGRGAILPK